MTKAWKENRETIARLYINENRTLEDVRKIMHKEYNFNASIRSYRQHFDKWNLSKYNCKKRTERRRREHDQQQTAAGSPAGYDSGSSVSNSLSPEFRPHDVVPTDAPVPDAESYMYQAQTQQLPAIDHGQQWEPQWKTSLPHLVTPSPLAALQPTVIPNSMPGSPAGLDATISQWSMPTVTPPTIGLGIQADHHHHHHHQQQQQQQQHMYNLGQQENQQVQVRPKAQGGRYEAYGHALECGIRRPQAGGARYGSGYQGSGGYQHGSGGYGDDTGDYRDEYRGYGDNTRGY